MNPRGPRVIIDTDVRISCLLTESGALAQLTRQMVGYGQPVFTPDTFAELKQRLWLPRFDRYVTMDDRERLLLDIDTVAYWFDVSKQVAGQIFCRDADGDNIIHAAVVAAVDRRQGFAGLFESLLASAVRIVSPDDALKLS